MDNTPQDDLKWFGEGFTGFPKKLPEDCVEYLIFIINSKLSDTQTRERLQVFQRALTSLEKKFLKEYIWQRDSINLSLIREDGRWLLKGSANFGDSVADEWLIVYFLRELSKEFKDAWIRIYDTDGEFLLIEAANALPKWLNPEIAEHRVWINDHRLLINPLSKQETPRPLQLNEALSTISSTPTKLQHIPKIEEEAFHRLKGYPAAISENQHHATLPLPRKIAHILQLNPSYIAPAVEAFYLRDPISLRFLQPSKSKTALIFPPEDFVNVGVRFTKVLYAQLLGQNWVPPGPYGEVLDHLRDNHKPSVSQEKNELAIKLSAGFEMLLQHRIYTSKRSVHEIQLLLSDLDSNEDTLPTDAEISSWPKREDDESWLNIDFAEFEKELAGKGGDAGNGGFGDKSAQENLRKMVERFKMFLDDEDAGLEGAGGLQRDPMDVDDDSDEAREWEDPEDSDSGAENQEREDDESDDDEYADAEFSEYEKALEKFMALSSAEKSALTDDARALATAEEADMEEEEEIRKLSEMMEAELFSHGALSVNGNVDAKSQAKDGKLKGPGQRMITSTDKGKGKAKVAEVSEGVEVEHGDEDDEEDGLLDDDYNLADNMLKAFKGQVGMAGPAGNLMGLMGIQFPPDADDEQRRKEGESSKS